MKTLLAILLLIPGLALADYIVYHPATDSFDTGKIRRDVPAALVDGYVVLEVLPGTKPTPSATENVVEVNAPCVSDYPTLTCTKQWTVQAKSQAQLDAEQCRDNKELRRQQARNAIATLTADITDLQSQRTTNTNSATLAFRDGVISSKQVLRGLLRALFNDPSENC